MSMIKKGETKSPIELLDFLYACTYCSHKETIKESLDSKKETYDCTECKDGKMVLTSNQSSVTDQIENVKKDYADGKFIDVTNTRL